MVQVSLRFQAWAYRIRAASSHLLLSLTSEYLVSLACTIFIGNLLLLMLQLTARNHVLLVRDISFFNLEIFPSYNFISRGIKQGYQARLAV